jgi:hypothetical protein
VPEYAKVENPEIVEAFTQRMKGRELTADNLRLTYYDLKREGKIPDAPVEPAKRKPNPETPTGGGSRVGTSNRMTQAQVEAMSREELRKHIEKQQAAARQQVH